jgi:hypothetical protein
MAGFTEHDGITLRHAAVSMTGAVRFTAVSFCLYDHSGKLKTIDLAHQFFS